MPVLLVRATLADLNEAAALEKRHNLTRFECGQVAH
jgi:hypothetical protein